MAPTKTKAILIEGIMGSGKTTTARFVAETLEKQNRASELYLEGNLDHPADYDAVSWLEEADFRSLMQQYPEAAPLVKPMSTQEGSGVIVPYGKLGKAIPLPLYQELQKQDIYEGIPLQKHQDLMMAKWSQFARNQADRDTTVVMECNFMQNPMCAFLAKHNAGDEAVTAHILSLAELIKPLNPLLIYFYQTDIRSSVERVCRERSPEWLEFVIRYHTEQQYGKAHGLQGFDGLIEFLQRRQELELGICKQLPFRTVVVDNTAHDWEHILLKIERAVIG